ncbi:NAD kinase [Gordonia jinhuaensis]|uniref:NAD kinase n=1 Tax=Gordonia jinhuaensis TaxID=1517702 RepID=A0A916TH39_9ACTN|nr:NAD kinase [Gordonia jinhuaensis]
MADAVANTGGREFLVVANTGREIVTTTLDAIARRCAAAGVGLRVVEHDLHSYPHHPDDLRQHLVDPARMRSMGADVEITDGDEESAAGCEVVIVLGGDGTFLRAAELAYPANVPLLGINLGHIGFLAEAEATHVEATIDALIERTYRVEERMTIDITVTRDGEVLGQSWALNEVSVQNASHQGVLGLVTEVDGRPVSAFGADGILVSTPSGSTAYAFSAGGPIMWPDLEAILVVPSNAHALFARPLVTSPRSQVAVEIERGDNEAISICDGRRYIDTPAGSRVEVVRGQTSLNWVRIGSASFTDRLVHKFDLPVTGWRGRQG